MKNRQGYRQARCFLGIEEDATLLTKAESAVTNESLRVDIIAAEGDTIKKLLRLYR